MKKIFTLLVCLPFIGFAQQTHIPDDDFEAFLEMWGMGNGIANDDSVPTTSINGVPTLELTFKNISNLVD